MKRLLVVIMFLTSAFALAFDGLARFNFVSEDSPSYYPRAIDLVLVVPARFPESSERISVSLVCGRGLSGNARMASPQPLPARWPEWVDHYQPVVTPNSISFAGFTFGCAPQWYFVEAPSLDELTSAFYRLGSLTGRYTIGFGGGHIWGYGRNTDGGYGLPAPSLVVSTLPFEASLGYAVGVVLPLRSPLAPAVYDIQQYGQSRPTRAPQATTLDRTVVAARQGGDLVPLVFESRISTARIDTTQSFELYVGTRGVISTRPTVWEHLLIDTSNVRLAYRYTNQPPATAALPASTLADLAARFDPTPAEPEPEPSAEAVEPEPEPEIELVEVQVQAGENLWVIAERHGVTVDEIVRINCLPDPYVNPGTRIKIPPTDQEIAPRCG